jgi:hypothetical protein
MRVTARANSVAPRRDVGALANIGSGGKLSNN